MKKSRSPISSLKAIDAESGSINAIIDTPKGSRNKYKFDEELSLFKLKGVMPLGAYFPYDFGYIPGTLGGDGDPLDVLVLMDEPAVVGCLVEVELIGVIEAMQTEKDGTTEKNDRLIGVAVESHNHKDLKRLDQLEENFVFEIEHYFKSYNEARGKRFEVTARSGPQTAFAIVKKGIQRANKGTRKKSGTKASTRASSKKVK
jgi:inorganic pyrophosphatase